MVKSSINTIKIIISLAIMVLFSSGCVKQNVENRTITDLKNIEQKPYLYSKNITPIPKKLRNKFVKDFEQNYFYPWHVRKFTFSYENATWGKMYAKKKVYSENLTLISKEWFDSILDDSNFTQYDTVRKKAITINNSHLKVFPTVSKIFYDPKQAGEGFPFDYNENKMPKGYIIDYVKLISKKISLEPIFITDKWPILESKFKNGEIDVLPVISYNPKRKEFLKFTEPYMSQILSIVTRY